MAIQSYIRRLIWWHCCFSYLFIWCPYLYNGLFVLSTNCSCYRKFTHVWQIPICASIWSCPLAEVLSFSAYYILLFFRDHHLLQVFPSYPLFNYRTSCVAYKRLNLNAYIYHCIVLVTKDAFVSFFADLWSPSWIAHCKMAITDICK